MPAYTDSPRFASLFLPLELAGIWSRTDGGGSAEHAILSEFFTEGTTLFSAPWNPLPWSHLVFSERSMGSQYDQMIRLARAHASLPDGLACLAGSGSGFHGFKGRPWAALPGNIHLSVHLAPRRRVDRFGIAFTILASLSAAEALDQVPGLEGEAQIKWVNDILLGDAKVGGILAYTQSQGEAVTSAVLGIGINVETTPEVDPTPFVPRVSSARAYRPTADANLRRRLFSSLLEALESNYQILLEEGVSPLLARYRARSMVVGREVTVCTETSDTSLQVVAEGRVSAVGEDLELILEDRPDPIRGGRLVMGRTLLHDGGRT